MCARAWDERAHGVAGNLPRSIDLSAMPVLAVAIVGGGGGGSGTGAVTCMSALA